MIHILIVAFRDFAIAFCGSTGCVSLGAFALLLGGTVVLLVLFLVRPSLVYVWHADLLAMYGEHMIHEYLVVCNEQVTDLLIESVIRRCYILEYLGLGKLPVVYHEQCTIK